MVTLALPFTFNTISKEEKDYKFNNNFASLTLFLRLTEDFDEAL